jgi:NADH dehydrogenase
MKQFPRRSGDSVEGAGRPRVVIVGGGFAGLEAVRALREAPVEVLMIDRTNYHTFQPLLYQVATAGLEPGEVAHTVRGIFQTHPRFRFRLGTVTTVDPDAHRVSLDSGETIGYDYLILAAGAEPEFFGVEGAEQHAFTLKTLGDATRLRSHLLRQFERAAQCQSSTNAGRLNVVIVGGGPTGVEMAGALVELIENVLTADFPEVDTSRAQVTLVEMTPHLLGSYDASLRDYTLDTLRERGVEVVLDDAVERVAAQAVHLESGRILPTGTLIWAAGVRARPLADSLGAEQTRGGRVRVASDLSLPEASDTFVVGDMAAATGPDGHPHPQLAPVAVQQGRHAARQIQRRHDGQDTEPFTYDDPGMMAVIGRKAAVVERPGGFTATGWLAWILWAVLHIWELIGFRNRLVVMLDWIYNYFTYDRSARLIFEGSTDPSMSVNQPSETMSEQ